MEDRWVLGLRFLIIYRGDDDGFETIAMMCGCNEFDGCCMIYEGFELYTVLVVTDNSGHTSQSAYAACRNRVE